MRFLLDQGLPRSLKMLLIELGYDSEHVGLIGMESAPDEDIINYAILHNYICITLDADFHSIVALSEGKTPSVIRIRIEKLKAVDYLKLLQQILPDIEKDLKSGCLVSVQEDSVRIRELPI